MPLPEPGPSPQETEPGRRVPAYVRMVILDELVCKGKETLPGAWEAARGSLCLEQSSVCWAQGGVEGSQIMESLRPGWAYGLVLEGSGSTGGFYAGQ